jgi:hypothetical protein
MAFSLQMVTGLLSDVSSSDAASFCLWLAYKKQKQKSQFKKQ